MFREVELAGQEEGRLKMARFGRLLTAALILVTTFSGCASKSKRQALATEAEARKIELLRRIERDYEDAEAHYELGKLYQIDGLWNKAEFEFNRAVGFNPGLWRAEAAIVKVLIQSGSEERARLAAEHCMNRSSFSAEASVLLGKGFQNEELDDYALACYQQALSLAPESAGIHKQIGYYYLSKGNLALAEEYLKRSFQLDRYQPEVAEELGRLGVAIEIPRKIEGNTKKLDNLLEQE